MQSVIIFVCVIRFAVVSLIFYNISKQCAFVGSFQDSTIRYTNILRQHPKPQVSAFQKHQRLDAMLKYSFVTPEMQLRQGLTYLGSNWRLRRAVHKLLTDLNPELWIGTIGGSITAGSHVDKNDIWFFVFQSWLVSEMMHHRSMF